LLLSTISDNVDCCVGAAKQPIDPLIIPIVVVDGAEIDCRVGDNSNVKNNGADVDITVEI
jgi:hypothetical protein